MIVLHPRDDPRAKYTRRNPAPVTRALTVRVTDQHIARGERSSMTADAIALALADAGVSGPVVSSAFIGGAIDGESFAIVPDDQLVAFIDAYDARGAVRPFEFQLAVPLPLTDPAEREAK